MVFKEQNIFYMLVMLIVHINIMFIHSVKQDCSVVCNIACII